MFYIVITAVHIDIPTLRRAGWVFDMGEKEEPWFTFYTYFSECCVLIFVERLRF